MNRCINACVRRLLPGFGGWVVAVIIAAIIAVATGNAALGTAVAVAAIAIGAAGVTVVVYCYFECRR